MVEQAGKFGDVVPSFQENERGSPVGCGKLLQIVTDQQKLAYHKVELVVIVDAGEAFVKETYCLEGDGPIVLTCFEILSTLAASIQTQHYPNLQAMAHVLSGGLPAVFQHLLQRVCVQPGLV